MLLRESMEVKESRAWITYLHMIGHDRVSEVEVQCPCYIKIAYLSQNFYYSCSH